MKNCFPFPMNLPLVAADVRRRARLIRNAFRLLTSAATVQGFKARTLPRGNLTPTLTMNAWEHPTLNIEHPTSNGRGCESHR